MSTNLNCVYEEEFKSKLGKTLKFRDELELRVIGTSGTYNILWYTHDGKEEWTKKYGREKTNQEIYEHYLLFIKENFKEWAEEVFEEFSYEDTIAIAFEGKPPFPKIKKKILLKEAFH